MEFKLHIQCPQCHKGEILVNQSANAVISVQCPRCKHFFQANLLTGVAQATKAIKRIK